MLKLSCHCGQVRIEAAARPDFIHACNCSLCTKTGARWGYYHPAQVDVAGATTGYCRTDKPEATAQVHFCPHCGSTTHFVLKASAVAKFGDTMLGVNMVLADTGDLAGIEQRYPDGAGWSGAGPFAYVRAPDLLEQGPAPA